VNNVLYLSAVNECEPNPCNGHICQNELSGYKCICSGGYTGHHCDVPPNFCEGNDCENGATCTNGVTNYTCICPPRIKGTFCEKTPGKANHNLFNHKYIEFIF
jgi:hypothetical protein